MTPERKESSDVGVIREWIKHQKPATFVESYAVECVRELLTALDARDAEVAALRGLLGEARRKCGAGGYMCLSLLRDGNDCDCGARAWNAKIDTALGSKP